MNDGNGKMIALLERIAAGQEQIREELTGTNAHLDNILVFLGSHDADHESRIQALEAHVFKKSG